MNCVEEKSGVIYACLGAWSLMLCCCFIGLCSLTFCVALTYTRLTPRGEGESDTCSRREAMCCTRVYFS